MMTIARYIHKKHHASPFPKTASLSLLAILCATAPAAFAAPTCNSLVATPAGGTIASGSTVTNASVDACFDNTVTAITNNGTINNVANASVTSQGKLTNSAYVNNYGAFTNYTGATFSSTVNSNFENYAGSSFTNLGTMNGNTNFKIDANATFVNSGAISITSGLSNSGSFTNAAGATYANNSTTSNTNGGTLVNNGTLSTGTLNNSAATVTNNNLLTITTGGVNSGTVINNSGATLNIQASSNTLNTYTSSGTWTNHGSMTIKNILLNNSGNFVNNGQISNQSSITNNGTFTNNGQISSQTISLINNMAGKTFNNNGSITLTGTTSNLTNSGQFNNNSGATLTANNGVTNKAGATLTNASGATIKTLGIQNDGSVVNEGTIESTKLLTVTSTGVVSGAGTTNITGGSAKIDGTLSQGAMSITGGAALSGSGTIVAPVTVSQGGILSNNYNTNLKIKGDLTFDGGKISNNPVSSQLGTTTVTDGSIYLLGGTTVSFFFAGSQPNIGDTWQVLSGHIVGDLSDLAFSFSYSDSNYITRYYDNASFLTTIDSSGLKVSLVAPLVVTNPPAVPLPATAWMFASGMAGLGALARRQSRNRH